MSRHPIIAFIILLILVVTAIYFLPNNFLDQIRDAPPQKPHLQTSSTDKGDKDEAPIAEKMTDENARKILGRSSWTLLHVMATKFPPTPTEKNTQDLVSFVQLLSTLYPCGDCAAHFKKYIKANPIHTGAFATKKGVATWFCNAHNDVNKRLGKPIYDCNLVTERWKW